jgi:putative phage-type endonuclease
MKKHKNNSNDNILEKYEDEVYQYLHNIIGEYPFVIKKCDIDDLTDLITSSISFYDSTNIDTLRAIVHGLVKSIVIPSDENNIFINNEFVYNYPSYKEAKYIRRSQQFTKLQKIPQPEQKSKAWFEARNKCITASAVASAINEEKYKGTQTFVYDKCVPHFEDSDACHHGKKYEPIANMIYSERYNIVVFEFGLLPHPKYSFLAASPDGICDKYALYPVNGKKVLSKLAGRMLEIKCPLTREIIMEGEIDGEICPHYYWIQVQIQLEVCDLDECDFWQCKLREYEDRDDFINDTDPNNEFLSKEFGLERGFLLQFLPINKLGLKCKCKKCVYNTGEKAEYDKCNISKYGGYGLHKECLYEAKFLYPPTTKMTQKEIDKYIADTLGDFTSGTYSDLKDFVFDRVIYWRLEKGKNVTILRDREWFKKKLSTIRRVWSYVEFYKNEKHSKQLAELKMLSTRHKGNTIKNIFNIIDDHMSGTNMKQLMIDYKLEKDDKDLFIKPSKNDTISFNTSLFLDSDENNKINKKMKFVDKTPALTNIYNKKPKYNKQKFNFNESLFLADDF